MLRNKSVNNLKHDSIHNSIYTNLKGRNFKTRSIHKSMSLPDLNKMYHTDYTNWLIMSIKYYKLQKKIHI